MSLEGSDRDELPFIEATAATDANALRRVRDKTFHFIVVTSFALSESRRWIPAVITDE